LLFVDECTKGSEFIHVSFGQKLLVCGALVAACLAVLESVLWPIDVLCRFTFHLYANA
jgi:hypothetical protein